MAGDYSTFSRKTAQIAKDVCKSLAVGVRWRVFLECSSGSGLKFGVGNGG